MKKWIHAVTESKSAESILKMIAKYLEEGGLGYSDNKTWAARITEEGSIECITIDDVKEAMSENSDYYNEDPISVFFDYADLITDRRKCTAYAKKHGFLEDFASY